MKDIAMARMIMGLFPKTDMSGMGYSPVPVTMVINGARISGITKVAMTDENVCFYGGQVSICIFWQSIRELHPGGIRRI
jgi:hypothetical protein